MGAPLPMFPPHSSRASASAIFSKVSIGTTSLSGFSTGYSSILASGMSCLFLCVPAWNDLDGALGLGVGPKTLSIHYSTRILIFQSPSVGGPGPSQSRTLSALREPQPRSLEGREVPVRLFFAFACPGLSGHLYLPV